MYSNYIFDLYGTLVDINTNEYDCADWQKLTETMAFYGVNYSAEELKAAFFGACEWKDRAMQGTCQYPEIDIVEVFQQLYANKGKKASRSLASHTAQTFRAFSTRYIRLYDGTLEVLQQLKKAKKNIYLLTNAQKVFTEEEIKRLGIKRYFKDIIYSSQEGCKKPDPKFFNALIEKHNLDRSQCIMIGNSAPEDMEGAYRAHIDGMYLHTNLSPKFEGKPRAKYIVENGDIRKVLDLLLKK